MNNLMDLGGGVGWIGTLFIGALAGWIAEKVMKADHGLLKNIIIGVIGSFIGAFLANAPGDQDRRSVPGLVLGQSHRRRRGRHRAALRAASWSGAAKGA
jgi:uncharacterized membrane protein YeaQ/YmgE (transglycosylase-associated protein family)